MHATVLSTSTSLYPRAPRETNRVVKFMEPKTDISIPAYQPAASTQRASILAFDG